VGQAVKGEIVEIGAVPGQKAQILAALGPVADADSAPRSSYSLFAG
jgi:hypothetical protein